MGSAKNLVHNKLALSNQPIVQLVFLVLAMLLPFATKAAQPVCANVKIEILQELTLERQAFDAMMRISNTLDTIAIENVNVSVHFKDENGLDVLASSDPNNTTAKFFIRVDSMSQISDVSGAGRVEPLTTAEIHWLIIPAPGSADGLPGGKLYFVGATLDYSIGGQPEQVLTADDFITVKPLPLLTLDYFLSKDVVADDPLTPVIETPEPFTLGVRVQNNGVGVANNVKIQSAQPTIVDNVQGLAIGFQIIDSSVNDQPSAPTLLADFGQINSNQSKVARWSMTSSLAGEFVDFTASFTHSDELGGQLTSILQATNAHYLLRDVRVDLPGRDAIRDFLASDAGVVQVYESDNVISAVSDISASATLTATTPTTDPIVKHTLSVPVSQGLIYARLPDPYGGGRTVSNVIRSDGKVIPLDNVWTSKTRNKTTTPYSWDYYVNFFDANTTGSYTVDMAVKVVAPAAPLLQFIPNRTVAEGAQLGFVVEATDVNNDPITITASPLPAGATFVDNGNGTATFNWVPATAQIGSYTITYVASDGKLSSFKAATIRVYPAGDSDTDGIPDDWELSHFGNLNQDAKSDFDGDGISDIDEYILGSDPLSALTPRMPMIQQPLDGAQVVNLQPALTIINTPDSGGETVSYEYELYRDPAMTDLVERAATVPQGNITTSWQPAGTLADNSWYYWRVRAYGGGLYSLWVYGRFFVNTANDAPGAFNVSYPKNQAQVDTVTPVLEINNSTDADQDALTYTFELFADAGLTSLITRSAPIAAGDGVTRWAVNILLTDGASYYWRVTAKDSSGAEAQTLASFTVNLANNTPGVPATLAPALNGVANSVVVTLTAGNSSDIEGDPLSYYFEIDTAATFDSPDKQTSPAVVSGAGNTSWTPQTLKDNTKYYWRVKANDGHTDSEWETAYFLVNTGNDVPSIPVNANPGERSWVATATPSFLVRPSVDLDGGGLSYEYEVYFDPDLALAVTQMANQGTIWNATGLPSSNKLYYWRARTQDNVGATSNWSALNKFVIINNKVNTLPQVTNPGTLDSSVGAIVSQQIIATDAELNSLSYVARGLPEGLAIDPVSGIITGTIAVTASRENKVTLLVSDGLGITTIEFRWTVGGGNSVPVVTTPGDQTSVAGSAVAMLVSATDADGDSLLYSATGLPLGLTIDTATGVISGVLAPVTVGGHNVTVSVFDGYVTESVNFTWTVNSAGTNHPPLITAPSSQTNIEGDVISLPVSASDADADTLYFSISGLPAGLSIDPQTGVISGTISLATSGNYLVKVSVNDAATTSSVIFSWVVGN